MDVVIVNYNAASYVANCIGSLTGATVGRIVVVDNDSSTADRERLTEVIAADPRVHAVWSATNVGFGAGVNLGVDHLAPEDDDLFVVLNPDTRVHDGALQALSRALSDGRFDVVTPTIYSGAEEEPVIWFGGGEIDLRRGETVHCDLGRSHRAAGGDRAISFITGAAPAMSGRTWRAIGGFREDLFLYWEDAEFSLRAAARSKRLGLVGDATIWHEEGGSSSGSGRSVAYYYYMQRNRILVLRPIVGLRRLLSGLGGLAVLRLIARALRERDWRWRKVRATVLGLLDGVRGRTGQRRL
ncbi:glycosyltransferase family 2 protein [Geodermatophilus sp. SYSU D00705]